MTSTCVLLLWICRGTIRGGQYYVCDMFYDESDRKSGRGISVQEKRGREQQDTAKDAKQRQQPPRWYAINVPAWVF
jgi:hypothetical protein